MTNVIYSLSRSALRRPSLTQALIERCYDESSGLFCPLGRPEPRERPALTWTALAPLALPDLPEAIGRRLVEEHLLDPSRFWLTVPPPSVAATDPTFSTRDHDFLRPRRYWRGPTWINAAWMIWLGLVRLGYEEPAAELAARLGAVVNRSSLREYYNPYSGAGMGAVDFAWSSLIMELTEPDEGAAGSHLRAASTG
jgi:hypothetical protein